MNDRISIGIDPSDARSGKDEIIGMLNDIESSARSTGDSINDSLDIDSSSASSGVDNLSGSFDNAESSAKDLGQSSNEAMSEIDSGSKNASNQLMTLAKRAAGVAAAYVSIRKAASWMREQAALADNILDTARIANMAADEFLRISHNIELAGMSQERFASTLRDLTRATNEYANYGSGRLSNVLQELEETTDVNIDNLSRMAGNEGFLYLVNSMTQAGYSIEEINSRLQRLNPNVHQITDNLEKSADGLYRFASINLRTTQTDLERMAGVHARIEEHTAKQASNAMSIASSFTGLLSDRDIQPIEKMSGFMDNISRRMITFISGLREIQNFELDELERYREDLMGQMTDPGFFDRLLVGGRGLLEPLRLAIDPRAMAEAMEEGGMPDGQTRAHRQSMERIREIDEQIERLRQRRINLDEDTNQSSDEATKNIVDNEKKIKELQEERIDVLDRLSNEERRRQIDLENLLGSMEREHSSLEMLIATYGQSQAEIVKYRLEHGDLRDAIILGAEGVEEFADNLIRMNEELRRLEDTETATNMMKDFQRQIDLVGLSARELDLQGIKRELEDLDIDDNLRDSIIEARMELYGRERANSFLSEAVDKVGMLKEELRELEEVRQFLNEEDYLRIREGLITDLQDAEIEVNEFLSTIRDFGESSREILRDSFVSVMEGDFQNAMNGMVSSFKSAIAQMVADQALNQLIGMISGMGGAGGSGGVLQSFMSGFLPGRRSGGYVTGGQSYIVGETGPEVYTPKSSGYIDNNHSRSSGGGSNNININLSGMNYGDKRQVEEAANRIASRTAQSLRSVYNRGDI